MGIKYTKISLRFHLKDETPFFIGSQIRGALGYALKRVVCINPTMKCDGCFASEDCLYWEWYEKAGAYHPFRLDFELGKPYYDFSLYLFGDATERLPYVVSALHRMITQNGLGVERRTTDRFEMSIDDIEAYRNGRFALPAKEPELLEIAADKAPEHIKISFVTPLRIKYRNRFVRDMVDIHLPTLVRSIYRRSLELQGIERQKLPFHVSGEIVKRFGTFKDLTRYSYRQRGKLKIGGMIGEIVVEDLDDESWRLLRMAEIIGIGKQTVFGLGKVKVDAI